MVMRVSRFPRPRAEVGVVNTNGLELAPVTANASLGLSVRPCGDPNHGRDPSDMHGNAGSWVEDSSVFGYAWVGIPKERILGRGSGGGGLRGGAWDSIPRLLRSAVRRRYDWSYRGASSGFRIARTLEP